MESVELVGCGVDNHDDDCLCDVVIPSPTPMLTDPVGNMWMGRELCEHRGHGKDGWTDDEILGYLSDLVYLHDMYIAQQKAPKVEQMKPARGADKIHPYRYIRVTVRQALVENGGNIRLALESSGITAQQFTLAASTGSWHMDMDTIIQFEQAIMDPKRTLGQLSDQFGLSQDIITKFRRYWPNRPTERVMRGQGGHPYQKRMRQLITDGMRADDVVSTIHAEFNITISKSSVHKLRSRMKEKGGTN